VTLPDLPLVAVGAHSRQAGASGPAGREVPILKGLICVFLPMCLLAMAAMLCGCGTETPVVGLARLTLAPASVKGGTIVTGTISLSSSPGGNGATATLASSNPTVAPVPETVAIPAGATTATFTTTTTMVTANTTVTIFATEGGFNSMAVLTVTP
jgi:ABC-type uncharacterized transport system auxiliary subunit